MKWNGTKSSIIYELLVYKSFPLSSLLSSIFHKRSIVVFFFFLISSHFPFQNSAALWKQLLLWKVGPSYKKKKTTRSRFHYFHCIKNSSSYTKIRESPAASFFKHYPGKWKNCRGQSTLFFIFPKPHIKNFSPEPIFNIKTRLIATFYFFQSRILLIRRSEYIAITTKKTS